MMTTALEKADFYAARANQLEALAKKLAEPARSDMLEVVAEYRKLAVHWAAIEKADGAPSGEIIDSRVG